MEERMLAAVLTIADETERIHTARSLWPTAAGAADRIVAAHSSQKIPANTLLYAYACLPADTVASVIVGDKRKSAQRAADRVRCPYPGVVTDLLEQLTGTREWVGGGERAEKLNEALARTEPSAWLAEMVAKELETQMLDFEKPEPAQNGWCALFVETVNGTFGQIEDYTTQNLFFILLEAVEQNLVDDWLPYLPSFTAKQIRTSLLDAPHEVQSVIRVLVNTPNMRDYVNLWMKKHNDELVTDFEKYENLPAIILAYGDTKQAKRVTRLCCENNLGDLLLAGLDHIDKEVYDHVQQQLLKSDSIIFNQETYNKYAHHFNGRLELYGLVEGSVLFEELKQLDDNELARALRYVNPKEYFRMIQYAYQPKVAARLLYPGYSCVKHMSKWLVDRSIEQEYDTVAGNFWNRIAKELEYKPTALAAFTQLAPDYQGTIPDLITTVKASTN